MKIIRIAQMGMRLAAGVGVLLAMINFAGPGAVSGKQLDGYSIFVPMVQQDPPTKKGAGVPDSQDFLTEDLPTLGANWYYNWKTDSTFSEAMARRGIEFVPMSFAGVDPKLPAGYAGYLLVFNEPDVSGQANLNQRQAVDRYLFLKNKYPQAQLVVGGVSVFLEWLGWYTCTDAAGVAVLDKTGQPIRSWMSCFLNEFERRGLSAQLPKLWHTHAYLNEGTEAAGYLTPAAAQQTLAGLYAKTGGTYWVTEFAEVTGNVDVFCVFTQWMNRQPWIERYAPFATRVSGLEYWYPAELWSMPQQVSLVDFASSYDQPVLSKMGNAFLRCAR